MHGLHFVFMLNMSEISVTVVIPVYNCDQFIENCIQSVISQTLTNFEIIILDDCSTDETLSRIPRDPRIRIFTKKEKHGSGVLRNEGIKLAKGKYIAFLDGDDFYPNKNSLKKLVEIAEKKKLDIVGGSLFIVNQLTNEINYKFPGQYFTENGFIKYENYQHDGGFYRFIYRSNFLRKNQIQFPSFRRMQDPVFFVEAMIKCGSFYVIKDYVYAYRKFHKEVEWNKNLVEEKLSAILLILKISRKHKLSHLHYLMVKNFINFSNRHLADLRNFKNQVKFFLLIYSKIDFKLLKEGWSSDKINFLQLKLFGVFFKSFFDLTKEKK